MAPEPGENGPGTEQEPGGNEVGTERESENNRQKSSTQFSPFTKKQDDLEQQPHKPAHTYFSGNLSGPFQVRFRFISTSFPGALATLMGERNLGNNARPTERKQYGTNTQKKLTYEQQVETFVQASGLRKAELERLRVRDFYRGGEHDFGFEEQWIHVDAVENIPAHKVPVAWYHEWIITELCKGHNPDDLIFSSLPDLDYEALRESYADELFLVYYDSLGATGAPRRIRDLGKLLKGALGLRKYDEKRRRQMRWASRDMRRMLGLL